MTVSPPALDTDHISFCWLDAASLDAISAIEEASFSHPWSRDAYAGELQNPLAHYLGCFVKGELVAFAGFWAIVDEAHVTNVAVAPAFRRMGLGELLMRRLFTAALLLNLTRMTLEVRSGNTPALSLYEKLGFEAAGLRPDYYDDPTEDAVIMWADLTACADEDAAD